MKIKHSTHATASLRCTCRGGGGSACGVGRLGGWTQGRGQACCRWRDWQGGKPATASKAAACISRCAQPAHLAAFAVRLCLAIRQKAGVLQVAACAQAAAATGSQSTLTLATSAECERSPTSCQLQEPHTSCFYRDHPSKAGCRHGREARERPGPAQIQPCVPEGLATSVRAARPSSAASSGVESTPPCVAIAQSATLLRGAKVRPQQASRRQTPAWFVRRLASLKPPPRLAGHAA